MGLSGVHLLHLSPCASPSCLASLAGCHRAGNPRAWRGSAQSGFGKGPATPSRRPLSRAAPGVGVGGVVWRSSRLEPGLEAVPWVSLSPLCRENPKAGVPEEGSQ